MKTPHDLRLLRPHERGYRFGSRRRRCTFCHIDEGQIEVNDCPVRAAGAVGKGAAETALAEALGATPEAAMQTPHTQDGLRRFDHLDPEEALAAAWSTPGPDPEWHLAAQTRLRDTMPLVHRAIQRIVERVKEEEVL